MSGLQDALLGSSLSILTTIFMKNLSAAQLDRFYLEVPALVADGTLKSKIAATYTLDQVNEGWFDLAAFASRLALRQEEYQLTFQSRFGWQPWLQPYTDRTLEALAQQGVRRVDVICPGFAADCLETLEEIREQNREIFMASGGEEFHYIPALNDRPDHIEALYELLLPYVDKIED